MTVRDADVGLRRHRPLERAETGFFWGPSAEKLVRLLAGGGDARITLDPGSGLNRYLSGPYPRDVLAYSSSTISDISPDAFEHLIERYEMLEGCAYSQNLEALREGFRTAFGLAREDAEIVFAPSGTDLEYVALACARGKGPGGVHNILLGADETGSGCIHSAHGRFFAGETALGETSIPAQPVPGCGPVSLVDVPVRCAQGRARTSAAITVDMVEEVEGALERGQHSLIHCVHGSKTGLVLPAMRDLEALQDQFGAAVTLVVDACQARITKPAIRAYLERGCIVLMTGSKFIGAPPFNGWALIPPAISQSASPLPTGFARIFRHAEWPAAWPGADILENSANISLVLRLTAALFELERFQAIAMDRAATLIDIFERAVEDHLIAPLGVRRVPPYASASADNAGPIEMRTLITLDMTGTGSLHTFAQAQALHRDLALDGIRLGQPVKCVRNCDDPEADWGASLRVGLSMPQMTRWAAMDDADSEAIMTHDMQRIASAIQARI